MNFSVISSATSLMGEPLKAFVSEKVSEKWLFILGGVHGDEPEGIFMARQLLDRLSKKNLSLSIVIFPLVNPDGYRLNTRGNAAGVDLNRNLPTSDFSEHFTESKYNPGPKALSEPESRFIVLLMKDHTPGFILSFHSWEKFILNTNGDCLPVAEFLSQHNHYPIAGDIGYPTPGSMGTYSVEAFDCPTLTFECPMNSRDKTLCDIWNENEKAFELLFDSPLLNFYKVTCS
jgi:protein MpaA